MSLAILARLFCWVKNFALGSDVEASASFDRWGCGVVGAQARVPVPLFARLFSG
jgi:hypothetical protein